MSISDLKLKSEAERIRELQAVIPRSPTHDMWADTQYEILKQYTDSYKDSLSNEQEICVILPNSGMEVKQISYRMPTLMIFRGYINGQKATLIQHINQLNYLLTSINKEPDKPRNFIGFVGPDK